MGMRAIAAIAGVHHYLQWGSPAYQVEAIATWLHICADAGVKPTADNYRYVTAATEFEGVFREVVAGPLPGDLDWLYAIDIEGDAETWEVTIDVRGPQLWAGPVIQFGQGPQAIHVHATSEDLSAVDEMVAQQAHGMARSIERMCRRDARTAERMGSELNAWRQMAERWTA